MTSIISSATSTIEAGLASVSDQINASLAAEKKADPLDPVTGSTAGKEGGGGDKVKSPIEEKLEGFFAHDRNEDKKALKEKGILKGKLGSFGWLLRLVGRRRGRISFEAQ
jgi:hypothetical protein